MSEIQYTISYINKRIQKTTRLTDKLILEFTLFNGYLKNLFSTEIDPIYYKIFHKNKYEIKKFDYHNIKASPDNKYYIIVAFTDAGFWFLKMWEHALSFPELDLFNHREFVELPRKTQISVLQELPQILEYIQHEIRKREDTLENTLRNIRKVTAKIPVRKCSNCGSELMIEDTSCKECEEKKLEKENIEFNIQELLENYRN